jgi:inosose dehydratase
MKLGFGTQIWINYGNFGNLFRMLDELALLKYDGFEIGFRFLRDMYGNARDQLAEILRIHGLEISACYAGLNYKDPEALADGVKEAKGTIDYYAGLGCPMFLLDAAIERPVWEPCPATFRFRYTDDHMKVAAETANALGEYVRKKGMRLAWHTHWGNFFEDKALFRRFWELTDPSLVGMCVDTGQCVLCAYDPVEFVKEHMGRILHLHFKDLTFAGRPQGELWPGGPRVPDNDGAYAVDAKGRWVELGRGVVDFPAITSIIRKAGYDGWIVDDFDFTCYPPMQAAKACKDYLNHGLGIWGRRDAPRT